MFDSYTITMFLFVLFLFHSSLAFYVKEDRYKKEISEFEEVETITDPVKVKLLMAQPAKEEIKFTPVLIPDKFSKYDSIDHDGHISLKELIKTTGAERNAKNAFQAADEDADGEISREEFKKAPWAMKPTSVNSKDGDDYIDESKFENITVEEEVEAEKVGRNSEGNEEEEEEGDEESVGDVEAGEKYEEGGEESFIEKVERREKVRRNKKENQLEVKEKEEAVKKDGAREEREQEEEEGDQEVIIEVNEKEAVEEHVKEAGEESKVGGVNKEEATENGRVGGDDRQVEVGGGAGEIENSEGVRNESVDVDKRKEGNNEEEKSEYEEKEKEENNEQEGHITKSKDKKYENLERHIHRSKPEMLDPHKLGSVPDKTVSQIDEDDLEGREWLDLKETSGELPEANYNQDSYSDEEQNTSEESYESFTD